MDTNLQHFVPPHCPRIGCAFHVCATGWRWVRFGAFRRQCEPRVIRRFRCLHCRATFSTQSFSTTYYLKRPELLVAIAHRLLACSGYRQIAREARCPHTTVMGQAARLGRHALLVLGEHRGVAPVDEPLVIDGFESFAFSQFQPLHLNLVVGADSHWIYGHTLSPLRRKGRMTPAQHRRREQLEATHGRVDPRAIELGMAAALRLAAPIAQPLTIRSDEHPAYPRAFKHLAGYDVQHECTPSVQARTAGNPLFPVNLLDLLLRHNSANHKRETIAHSKRHQAAEERSALLTMWRNFSKPFSENHDGGTPAMRRGLATTALSLEQLLAWRRFPGRIGLPAPWDSYYRRLLPTQGVRNPRRHALTLAF